jgi:4-diphosphocytidyl-2-C-methyl-D-erythritol kinase
MTLHTRAYSKVNLCLFLGPIRPDGRHELVTLMEPLSLADELTMTVAPGGDDAVTCPGVEGPNLVGAALAALRSRGWDAPPVSVAIEKRIPVAGGMGGGSADAAAALRLAAELAPVRAEVLAEVAQSLGSDVPGLVDPGVMLATGAGEVVLPLPELAPHAFAVLPQRFGLSTAEVYAQADRMGLRRSVDELDQTRRALLAALEPNAELPAAMLVNDLQPAALSLAPQLEAELASLRAAGADHATVCGSGPTVVGLFRGPDAGEHARAAVATLTAEHPRVFFAEPIARVIGAGDGAHLRGGAQSAGR